jgi:N-acyl-D-aspartate/D-glutamate deacylase
VIAKSLIKEGKMAYDLLIKNGTVVDGTGAPPYRADVAIQGKRIAEIGKIKDTAAQVIDAVDLIVAPGFIDPHTHYDAQVSWDPLLSISSWHGVTSVVMGNCGVGLAPCKPDEREMAMMDLVNVEAIPFSVLQQNITWEWGSFPEYMDAIERRGVGLNVAFLAPLSPFRRYVMGHDFTERSATPQEIAKIQALLREALEAGAVGLSNTAVSHHTGYMERRLWCRHRDELKAYANVLKELGRGVFEMVIAQNPGVLTDEEYELIDLVLTESGRPVTWIALFHRNDRPDAPGDALRKTAPLSKRGAVAQTTCRPLVTTFFMERPAGFSLLPCWQPALNQPREAQKRIYRDLQFRNALRESLKKPTMFSGNWSLVEIKDAHSPALKPLIGKTIAEIARERHTDEVDTFFDLALEDDLQIEYLVESFNTDESKIPELINDPRIMVGLSDAGAHVETLCDAGYCTYLLGRFVREKQAISLERAVQRLTSEPADFFGLKGRGRLGEGAAADLTVFDLATVGSAKRPKPSYDLPGGARRMIVEAHGIEYTIVNGRLCYEHGKPTGDLNGQVLRSGA